MHRVLSDDAVEHKLVTYQYRYTTRLREEAIGTRTAVIYRDNHSPNYPWWLVDERTRKPVWLPNGDVQKQVQFYAQHHTEIVDVKEFPTGAGSGKSVISFDSPKRPQCRAKRPETAHARSDGRRAPAGLPPQPVGNRDEWCRHGLTC
jgi:hypothetical protein